MSHTTAQPIIIDTDPGVDDAMALLLAAAAPELEILGVTTLFGNGRDVWRMARNAGAILELAGRAEIPVLVGAADPLARPYPGWGTLVHGENGLGGAHIPDPQNPPLPQSAATWIVEQARARAGEITLVTLASLTNIALALGLEPRLPQLIKRVVMMGGALNVPGNATPTAEANIHNDPEAARVVFNAGWEIRMAGLNVTHSFAVAEPFLQQLRRLGSPAGDFLAAASEHYLAFYRGFGMDGLYMHDVHAVMVLLHPELYSSTRVYVDVELDGTLTRGQTIADWRGQLDRPAQTDVLTHVDADAFLQLFLARMESLPR